MPITVYDHIAINRTKTIVLIILFPLAMLFFIYALMFIVSIFVFDLSPLYMANIMISKSFIYIIATCLSWIFISMFAGPYIMLDTVHAKPLERGPDNKDVFSVVENVARTAGLPVPKLYTIRDDSLNIFTAGRNPKNAHMVFTRGAVKSLNKTELEALVAHEMAHIGNRDVGLMTLVITGIGIFTLIGEKFYYLATNKLVPERSSGFFFIISKIMLFYGLFFTPLIMYGVSGKKREHHADACAALITRNPSALADLLAKISLDSRVEIIDKMPLMSAACIEAAGEEKKGENLSFFSNLFSLSTHPPILSRIRALSKMDGRPI